MITGPVSGGGAVFYGMAALTTCAMLVWLPTMLASVVAGGIAL